MVERAYTLPGCTLVKIHPTFFCKYLMMYDLNSPLIFYNVWPICYCLKFSERERRYRDTEREKREETDTDTHTHTHTEESEERNTKKYSSTTDEEII